MSIKIKKLSFIAGSKIDTKGLEFQAGIVTILVGPNNSGKSETLKEVESLCTNKIKKGKIIKEVELIYPENNEEREKLLHPFEIDAPQDDQRAFRKPPLITNKAPIQKQHSKNTLINILSDLNFFKSHVVPFYLERLDVRSRFSLVEAKPISNLKENTKIDFLSTLFRNDKIRKRIRKITHEAFNLYFVVDRTGSQLCIRMSRKDPPNNKLERGADNQSIQFHTNADLITNLGDGIQSFVGLIAGLLSLNDSIILIDEPEAFLADSIARKLGNELSKIAHERKASLIVSTHNADFVMGCVESASSKLKIIRLTYQNQKATAKEVPSQVIEEFNKNPCLRSSAALRGLFHKGVIVTEGHRDRVFYDELNRRLKDKDKGVEDVLFIDSGGGINMIFRTVGPLRKMGVPSLAIVDIDFITRSDKDWENLLNACQITQQEQKEYKDERDKILKAFKKCFKTKALHFNKKENSSIKKSGINLLTNECKQAAQSFIEKLAEYGLFIVPVGELESWMPDLRKEPSAQLCWDENVFKKLSYPCEDDFDSWWGFNKWSFMKKIAEWINDPSRKGVD